MDMVTIEGLNGRHRWGAAWPTEIVRLNDDLDCPPSNAMKPVARTIICRIYPCVEAWRFVIDKTLTQVEDL